jgi:hypothetical protein
MSGQMVKRVAKPVVKRVVKARGQVQSTILAACRPSAAGGLQVEKQAQPDRLLWTACRPLAGRLQVEEPGPAQPAPLWPAFQGLSGAESCLLPARLGTRGFKQPPNANQLRLAPPALPSTAWGPERGHAGLCLPCRSSTGVPARCPGPVGNVRTSLPLLGAAAWPDE